MLGQIVAGAQAVLGLGQTIAGMVKKKPPLPEYDIPQEVYDNMTDAEYWSFQGLPEASKQQFVEQTKRTGATALSRSSSRKGGLGLVSSIAQQEADANTELLSRDAEARMSNLDRLFQARTNVAQFNDKKQEWDKERTMIKRDEINQLIGSGLQNLMGAGGTSAAIDAYSDDNSGGIFSRMFGGKKGGSKYSTSATTPNAVKAPSSTPGIFSSGTYDKLPFSN